MSKLAPGACKSTTSQSLVRRAAAPLLTLTDQAYRTAQEVFLIFSANGSGEFFGYAKMIEAIDKEKAASRASRSSYKSSSATIDEERPSLFISSSQSRIASSSPGEMTPGFYEEITRRGERRTESPPARMKGSADHISIASAPARARTHPVKDSYFPPNPRSSEGDAKLQEVRGGSNREQQLDDNGVLRKDTVRTPEIKPEDKPQEPPDARGELFKIEWVKVGSLPFSRTRQYRNPWNQDREVKVSRDGTELEPGESEVISNTDGRGWNSTYGRVGRAKSVNLCTFVAFLQHTRCIVRSPAWSDFFPDDAVV